MPLTGPALQALQQTDLFGSLPQEALTNLLRSALTRRLGRGEHLFDQGDESHTLFIVLSGHIKIGLTAANGKELILDYLGPGSVIGEIGLFDRQPRSAAAVAAEPAELVELRRRDVQPFLERQPALALRLLETMARRIRRTNSLVEGDRALPMAARLARCLLRLTGPSGGMRFRVSQTELGEFAGISRENVNRQLQDWDVHRLVSLNHGQVAIEDRASLAAIADYSG